MTPAYDLAVNDLYDMESFAGMSSDIGIESDLGWDVADIYYEAIE